jgi:outer membrane cobalamin receptor
MLVAVSSWGQEVTLTGKIIDQNTAREISRVKISIPGTDLSTSSDDAGQYTFRISHKDREARVVFEHPDYQTREMLLNDFLWEKTIALTPLELGEGELVLAGTVRDQTTQREIAGVRIAVKGTGLSTTSDAEGKFSLRLPGASRGTPMVFQHDDYQIREVPASALAGMAFVGLISKRLAGSEEISIAGVVRDRNTHREIKGVNVFMKDGKIGTTSDFAGRYSLRIPDARRTQKILFRHIGYEPREILLDSLVWMKIVDLQPRVISLPGVQVEAEAEQPAILEKDLPQPVAIVDAKAFEIRGFTDAGDLLKTDQSVQVEEDLSGKKTAAIRGGNPDEVVVMYNGVKMNSVYDNVFDLSLIELGDIERFEIIKGSNTALYGPEAFSGVINIVPKIQNDYTLRFQQRFGTYRSGNWGLFAHKKIDRFIGSYSFKRGATKRTFADAPEGENELRNSTLNHTANLLYSFSERSDGTPKSSLGAMYVYTSLNYENDRDLESLASFSQLLSAKYASDQSKWYNLDLIASARRLEEEQSLTSGSGSLDRSLDDRALQFDAEKRLAFGRCEVLGGYHFQNAELDYQDVRRDFIEQPLGLESAGLQRKHHGTVAIFKLHNNAESETLQGMDVDVSVRHDRVHDQQSDPVVRSGAAIDDNAPGVFTENEWSKTTFKFALNFAGIYAQNLSFNTYLNFGTNVKFPTLLQQISAPELLYGRAAQPNLAPEENNSVEIGATVSRDVRGNTAIYGWQIRGNFFQNHYSNKFRVSITPGVPIAFYDNSPNARISGVEGNAMVFLFRKKVAVEVGLSNYSISDKSAFPFKSEHKYTLNFNVDHAGYSFQAHLFREGEQSGYVRFRKPEQAGGGQAPPGNVPFYEVTLPAFSNLDLHLSKSFQLGKLKLYANASGRNLLNDTDVVLEGLAIRDRRVYLTIGAQY